MVMAIQRDNQRSPGSSASTNGPVLPPEADIKQVAQLYGDAKWASQVIGLSRTTILKAAYDGTLRSFKVGDRRLFALLDLQIWINLHERYGA